MSRIVRLWIDQRGVSALEFGILGLFVIGLLLPISDVASVAIADARVKQTMRDLAAWAQYNPPSDITTPATTWPKLPNTMVGYTVSARPNTTPPAATSPGTSIPIYITVLCGDPPGAACTAADVTNTAQPKWFFLSSNLVFTPIFLTGLTGGVVTFSERFQ